MIKPLSQWSPIALNILNWVVIVGSVSLCALALPVRLTGMELTGIGPNWLLIWVVAWSIKRTALQAVCAGIALGFIQDGMTSPYPTHALGLALVGFLTARLQKQRYLEEDFISVALIVFGMAVIAETVMALQFSLLNSPNAPPLADIWLHHQRAALSSAILSSLWAPAVYYPLNLWWERLNWLEQQS